MKQFNFKKYWWLVLVGLSPAFWTMYGIAYMSMSMLATSKNSNPLNVSLADGALALLHIVIYIALLAHVCVNHEDVFIQQ